jgi:hypothetical protein
MAGSVPEGKAGIIEREMERWREGEMGRWGENIVVKAVTVKVLYFSQTCPSGFAPLNPDFSGESDAVRLR